MAEAFAKEYRDAIGLDEVSRRTSTDSIVDALEDVAIIVNGKLKRPSPVYWKGPFAIPPPAVPPRSPLRPNPYPGSSTYNSSVSSDASSSIYSRTTDSSTSNRCDSLVDASTHSPYQFRAEYLLSEIGSITSLRGLPDGSTRRLNPKIARIRNYEQTYTQTYLRSSNNDYAPQTHHSRTPTPTQTAPKRRPPAPPTIPEATYQRRK